MSPRRAALLRPAVLVPAALGVVYVIWGSTYLAIRIGIRTMPPLLMASVRFIAAGAILYAIAVRRGDRAGDRPGRRQWIAASIVGAALLFGGNGGVSWAEQHVPTGITALLVATVPLWMTLIARVWHKERLRPAAAAGIVIGFGGVAVLIRPEAGHSLHAGGVLVVLLAALSWAAGSVYARRAPLPRRPLVSAGMELMAGGVVLGIVGIAGGELGRVDASAISGESLFALGYLIVFGSIVAFSSYVYVLHNTRTSVASTYAYVNPVVAVLLGATVLDEAVTGRTLAGGAIIIVAVALIVTARAAPPAAEPGGAPPAAEELETAGDGATVPVRLGPHATEPGADRGS